VNLFGSCRPLTRSELIGNVRAGIALAAMSIPQVLGYTRIAGMPIVTGLYTLLLPPVAFAALGSSRYLVVAADSATAAILASGLGGMATIASPQYVELAGYVALLTAIFLLLGRAFKLGFIADFLSRTVLVGFLIGVGFQVGIAVLGETLGLETHSRNTIIQVVEIARELPSLRLLTPIISATVLAVVLVLKRWAPKVPGGLVAVVGATAASAMWDFSGHGVAIIGSVSNGLPHLGQHLLPWKTVAALLPVAGSCAIMIVTQSAATSRIYALRHQQKLDVNRDMVGLSAANAVSALSGTFVVNGSPTQTALVESVGGTSQIAHIATAGTVAAVLLFCTRPLAYLPQCVLGALVLLVAIHLIDIKQLQSLRKESPGEYALALTTAVVVITTGVEAGIVLAMVLSLLRIVRHTYHPHTGIVVLDANNAWKIIPISAGAVTEPGLVLYRFGAALYYANAPRFAEEVLNLAGPEPSTVRWVVVDAEAMTNIDYSASRTLLELAKQLAAAKVSLGFARVPESTKDDLVRHHLLGTIPQSMIFDRLHDAITAFEEFKQTQSSPGLYQRQS
jgi:sulfate permease, SulP family